MPETPLVAVRVWDLPTRVFHWALACAVTGSLVSAQLGGNAMVWHFRFGYAVLAMMVFRLLWGLVGGRWSRFSSFVFGPGALRRYLRGTPLRGERLDVGHSPLGALSVFALLALLTLQASTGLVADDEIANVGPLNRYVTGDQAASATSWHTTWGQWLIFGLIGLHVLAIVFYRVRRHIDLLRPMLVGDKLLPADTPGSADGALQRVLALLLLAGCAGLAWWVAAQGG